MLMTNTYRLVTAGPAVQCNAYFVQDRILRTMDVRRLIRGRIPWPDIERVIAEVRRRYDRPVVRVEFLDTDNWLSTPCVVDEQFFVKIISPQNALVHALFTNARNLGALTSGSAGFFERFANPYEMALHELEATETLRDIGINAPRPVEAFEVDEFGVLVLEYLPEFESLDELGPGGVSEWSPVLFSTLSRMHEHNLAHGDLRGENIIIYGGKLYFIDATNVSETGIDGAIAYDIASALAELSPRIGPRRAVDDALQVYSIDQLLAARDFLDIVRLRPDHNFDAGRVKDEIETRASREARR